MADPIPAADPALLAAQAKAGQAGVDAYKAAQNSLTKQRQAAVQQAMQEAALRGAPAGAIPSIGSTITQPYDQGIAQMTAGSANYQADISARDRRMDSYNQAVLAARSYIPQQTELAVAPIRAQGEFNVRQTEQQGRSAVDQINAEANLSNARMAAALQAARIKAAQDAAKAAASSGAKVTQGQLAAALAQGAGGFLGDASTNVSKLLSSNEEAIAQAFRSGNTVLAAHLAAAQKKSQQQAAGAAEAGAATASLMLPSAAAQAVPGHSGTVMPPPPSYITAGLPGMADIHGGAAQMFQVPGATTSAAPSPTTFAPSNPAALAAAIARIRQISAAAPGTQASTATQATNIGNYLHDMQGVLRQSTAAHSTFDPVTHRQILATAPQIANLAKTDQFSADLLTGAARSGQAIIDPGGFNQYVMGDPTADIQRAGQNQPNAAGVPTQYASDAMQLALSKAVAEIEKANPNISDAQLADAVQGLKGASSAYNLNAAQESRPTSQQTFTTQAAQNKAQQTVSDKAQVATAKQWLQQNGYGAQVPSSAGDALDVYNMLNDPEKRPDIDKARTVVEDLIQNWDTKGPKNSAGKPTTISKALLRNALRQQGVPSDLWDIAMMNTGV